MWRATVLTIFPDMFPGPLGASLAGKASARGLWSLAAVDIRDYATDKHRARYARVWEEVADEATTLAFIDDQIRILENLG